MSKQIHVPPYLTQDEVNSLPDGTRISVTWPSGNGPFHYTIKKHSLTSKPFAVVNGVCIWSLDSVGDKAPYTLVTLAVP